MTAKLTAADRRKRRLERNQETREANERRQAESKGRWPMTIAAEVKETDDSRAEIWL